MRVRFSRIRAVDAVGSSRLSLMPAPLLSAPAVLQTPAVGRCAPDPRALAPRALTTFAVLWGFAALFHQAAYPEQAFGLSALFVTLPAIWLLLRPRSVGRLLFMATMHLVQVGRHGPASVSNHWVLAAAVDLALVLAFAWLALRRRRAPDGGALFTAFAPAARLNLLVLYFYAVFHKINRDFLDPAVSCAASQYAQLDARFPVLPSGWWASYAAIYGTLVIEALIPALLVWRRTRVAGVLLGVGFHYLLALNPGHRFFDFASVLLALYFLFVPFDYLGALRARAAGRTVATVLERVASRRMLAAVRVGLIALGALLLGAYLMRLGPDDPAAISALAEGVRALSVLYGVTLLAVFAVVTRRVDIVGSGRGLDSLFPRPAVLALAPALLVANGLTPYVGLKTESSFAMFSNLRTEGGQWNHLVLSPAARVAGYQDDLVRVLDSSDPELRRLARRGALVPFFEFRVRVGTRPDASVTYERAGHVYRVAHIADAPELARPTRLQRTFLRFRTVDPPGQGQRCRH